MQWQTEVKFKGQARAGKMLLDAKLKADDMRRFLPRVLPLAFGFALAVTNPLVGLMPPGDPGGAWRYSIVLSDQQLSHCQLSTQRVMVLGGKR